MDPTTPDAIDPPANVLLLHAARKDTAACRRLTELGGDRAEILVTFSNEVPDTPDLDGPSKIGVVSVGDVLRSDEQDEGPDFSASVVVDSVPDPTDLSAIGVSVSRFCEYWSREDRPITLCFESLDALLRGSEPKTVFQFTHVLTKRLTDVGANAHFHLDPAAHDDRVIATFGTIFDEVVADRSAGTLPEATDEAVANTLAEWVDDGDDVGYDGPSSEATDEDVARSLEQ